MILGLTGGIATGKSTVSEYLSEKGYHIVDADRISKEVARDNEVLDKIVKEFGSEMVVGNRLNRVKMREVIFKDRDKVESLNGIMHPPIIKRIKEEIEEYKNEVITIADIPLLYENNLEYLVEQVLLISCSFEEQLKRIMLRDGSDEEVARNIIDKQMPLKEKKKLADYIIENDEGYEELKVKVDGVIKNILDNKRGY